MFDPHQKLVFDYFEHIAFAYPEIFQNFYTASHFWRIKVRVDQYRGATAIAFQIIYLSKT